MGKSKYTAINALTIERKFSTAAADGQLLIAEADAIHEGYAHKVQLRFGRSVKEAGKEHEKGKETWSPWSDEATLLVEPKDLQSLLRDEGDARVGAFLSGRIEELL